MTFLIEFADDTSVLFTHSPRTDTTLIINQQQVKLQNGADTWHVTFNPKKIKVMTVTTAKHPAKLSPSINVSPIETVTSHKHLELILNSWANWYDQINSIIDCNSSRIGILKSLKYKLNRKSLKIIYIAHIRSILEYGDVVWDGNLTSDQALQLERIQ